jgi:tRNA-2-methylthio-N6-dimethylallyladenosine synthase
MREVGFDHAYIFKYSKRRGTPAADMPEQAAAATKEERNQRLLAIWKETSIQKNNDLVGQIVEVLVEGPSAKNARRLFGRTRTNKGVVFEGNDRHKGQLLRVRVARATGATLYADPVTHDL